MDKEVSTTWKIHCRNKRFYSHNPTTSTGLWIPRNKKAPRAGTHHGARRLDRLAACHSSNPVCFEREQFQETKNPAGSVQLAGPVSKPEQLGLVAKASGLARFRSVSETAKLRTGR
jgi:hypothetical protein